MVFPGVEVYGSTRKWHAMRALQIFFDQLLCSVGAFERREFGKQAPVEKRWHAHSSGILRSNDWHSQFLISINELIDRLRRNKRLIAESYDRRCYA